MSAQVVVCQVIPFQICEEPDCQKPIKFGEACESIDGTPYRVRCLSHSNEADTEDTTRSRPHV